jgi:hypothetical protein
MSAGIVVGIATRYRLDGPVIESLLGARFSAPFHTGPWDLLSLLYKGYGVLPGGKAAGALTTHPILAPRLKKEYSYASTPPSGPLWPVLKSTSPLLYLHY